MSHINPIQIQKFLKGVDYPTSKATLIENAKNLGADENICSTLEQLPDEDFQTPADISQAFGRLSDEPGRSSTTTGSSEFLAQAIQDSMAEIEQCELALEKTSNDEIKIFAQQMIDGHSQIGREIEQLCAKKNIDLPQDVNAEQSSTMQELSELSGQDFDKKFMEHNVNNHEKDIKIFTHYAEQETDADVRALADKGAKMLSQHLDMAKQINQKI